MAQVLNLGNFPNQSTRVSLTVDGNSLTLVIGLSYNSSAGWWSMSIADQFSNPLISSVPLLTGVYPAANILAPYSYMKIGSVFIINQSGAASDWPSDTNFATGFTLLWDDTAH